MPGTTFTTALRSSPSSPGPTRFSTAVRAGTGAVVTLCLVGRARRGFPLRAWLPRGYPLVLVGVVLFGLGGVFDSVWHSLFGFEVRLETLLSPAHLWLVVAYTLVVLGVLHAAAQHRTQTGRHEYRPSPADIPLLLGFGLLFRVILWSLFYSDPLAVDYASGGRRRSPTDAERSLSLGQTHAVVFWHILAGVITRVPHD